MSSQTSTTSTGFMPTPSLFSASSTVSSSQSSFADTSDDVMRDVSPREELNLKTHRLEELPRVARDSGVEKRVGGITKAGMAFNILAELIDECALEVLFEVHRERKMAASVCQICHTKCRDYCTKSNHDIFGRPYYTTSTLPQFECVNCHTMIAAARYAHHLEKCLGFSGRTSSRVAQRRIGSSTVLVNGEDSSLSDADGGYGEKKRKKLTSGKANKLKRSVTPDPTHLSPKHSSTHKKNSTSPLRKGIEMQRSHSLPNTSQVSHRISKKRPPGEASGGLLGGLAGKQPPQSFLLRQRSMGKKGSTEGSGSDDIDIDDSTIEVMRQRDNRGMLMP